MRLQWLGQVLEFELADRPCHRKGCVNRTFGIILTRLRIPEQKLQSVGKAFDEEPAMRRNGRFRAHVTLGKDLAQIFGIDAAGYGGSAEAASHGGYLSSGGFDCNSGR
jgi:hypothetical protein